MTLPLTAHCRTVARESRENCAFIKTNVRVSVRGCLCVFALSRFPSEASAKDFPASAMRVLTKNELSTEFSTLSAADRRQLEARRGQGEGEGRRASAPPHCCEHAFGIGNKHQTHVQPARHSLRVYAVVVVSAHDTYTQASISVCVCGCCYIRNMIDNARAQFP